MSLAQRCQVNCFTEMGLKVLAIFIVAAASTCSGLDIELKIQNDPQCQFKGQQCSADLTKVIYCTDKGGNSHIVAKCEPGKSCMLDKSGEYVCSEKKNPNPPENPTGNNTAFVCQGDEAYPDANQCNIAYMCESQGAFPTHVCECPKGSALIFSPGMTCTTKKDILKDCLCPSTNRCKDGLGARDFGLCHPQFFYMCRNDPTGGLVPDVYKCPPGQYYYEGKCQKPTAAIKLAEQSGKDPVCKEYHPPCFPEGNIRCSKKGELLPHNKIDRCYYFCDDKLRPTVRDCGVGSYFTCKYGQCGCVFRSKP